MQFYTFCCVLLLLIIAFHELHTQADAAVSFLHYDFFPAHLQLFLFLSFSSKIRRCISNSLAIRCVSISWELDAFT